MDPRTSRQVIRNEHLTPQAEAKLAGSSLLEDDQEASSDAHSTQIVPLSANVPISVLGHGSDNGDVHPTNKSVDFVARVEPCLDDQRCIASPGRRLTV